MYILYYSKLFSTFLREEYVVLPMQQPGNIVNTGAANLWRPRTALAIREVTTEVGLCGQRRPDIEVYKVEGAEEEDASKMVPQVGKRSIGHARRRAPSQGGPAKQSRTHYKRASLCVTITFYWRM